MISIGLHEHECEQCGKKFECRSEYAYKKQRRSGLAVYRWFCSYKCMRAYETTSKKHPTKRESEILDQLNKGLKCAEICKNSGVSKSYVYQVKNKWRGLVGKEIRDEQSA